VGGGGEAGAHGGPPTRSGERMSGYRFSQDGDSSGYQDSGTYSRFFLIPKADRADREPVMGGLPTREVKIGGQERHKINPMTGRAVVDIPRANVHPTVKPVELMRHLVRLVTPPGGLVLDPFLGSGSTAIACEMEGFRWVGIEKEESYVEIARARLNGIPRGLGLDTPAPTRIWKDYPTAIRYPVKGPSQSSWFTDSTRGTSAEESPSVDGVDLELFPRVTGPAESDEVA